MNLAAPHSPKLVRDVMTTEVVAVGVDAGLVDVATLVERHAVSGLPVLDGNGTLVGVISESDLLRARATDYLWAQWPSLRVRHLMTTPALTIGPGEPLTTAARRMERHHVSRLIVVADDDMTHAIGVIAIADLLRAMADPGDEPPEVEALTAEAGVPDLGPDAPEERGD